LGGGREKNWGRRRQEEGREKESFPAGEKKKAKELDDKACGRVFIDKND